MVTATFLDRPAPPTVAEEPEPACPTSAENHLIGLQSIYSTADAIMQIFLSLYLFKLGGVASLAIFYCVRYTALTAGFVAVGKLFNLFSTRQFMRAGLLCTAAVYALLIAMGHSAAHWIPLLGVLSGFGVGIYWPGVNVTEYVVTHNKTRNLYFGKLAFLTNVAGAVGPLLAGGIFTAMSMTGTKNSSYYVLFGVLIALLLYAWFHAGSSGEWRGMDYSVHSSLRRPTREWSLVAGQRFFAGLWRTTLGVFSPILLFETLGRELNVSLFATATTVLTAAFAVGAGHLLHRWHRTYLIGVLSAPFGLLAFASNHSWLGLTAYLLLVNAFDVFAVNSACKAGWRAVDRTGLSWQRSYHLVVEMEFWLNAGRVTGFLIVLGLMWAQSDLDAVRSGIIVMAPLALIAGLFLARLERKSPDEIPTTVSG